MDTTALEAKITELQAQVSTDETTLQNDQEALTLAQAELAQANLVNQLETLSPADLQTLTAALEADGFTFSLVAPGAVSAGTASEAPEAPAPDESAVV